MEATKNSLFNSKGQREVRKWLCKKTTAIIFGTYNHTNVMWDMGPFILNAPLNNNVSVNAVFCALPCLCSDAFALHVCVNV